jgi:glycerol-3-phosphate acyltransferase PlsY
MVLSLVLSGILGYLIGSIPTAFLLVRWKSNVDIRNAGSGNVGALNSLQVTKSKFVGGGVLLLDMLKGIVVVVMASIVLGDQFSIQATAGVTAVVGHNFPVWLKFKGGRGLATAAGVMLVLAWVVVLIWVVFWVVGLVLTKHVNAGNTIASAATLLGIVVAPEGVLASFIGPSIMPVEFKLFALPLFIAILAKHIDPVREYLGKLRVTGNDH